MYALIKVTYDYHRFEELEQLSSDEDKLAEYAKYLSYGRDVIMYPNLAEKENDHDFSNPCWAIKWVGVI